MDTEKILGIVALVWLIGAILMMSRLIRKGRGLARNLEIRHPELYREWGRPRPSYFESVRRGRFAQFVGQRKYAELDDPELANQFESYRNQEARALWILLASLVALFLLIFLVREGA